MLIGIVTVFYTELGYLLTRMIQILTMTLLLLKSIHLPVIALRYTTIDALPVNQLLTSAERTILLCNGLAFF